MLFEVPKIIHENQELLLLGLFEQKMISGIIKLFGDILKFRF